MSCALSSPAAAQQDYLDLDDLASDEDNDAPQVAEPIANTKSAAARCELEDFLNTSHMKVSLDEFFKDAVKAKYPHLRLVVLAVLGAFLTSVESKREFSTAGKDATAARSALRPEIMRNLTYLALNAERLRDFTEDDERCKKITAPEGASSGAP